MTVGHKCPDGRQDSEAMRGKGIGGCKQENEREFRARFSDRRRNNIRNCHSTANDFTKMRNSNK